MVRVIFFPLCKSLMTAFYVAILSVPVMTPLTEPLKVSAAIAFGIDTINAALNVIAASVLCDLKPLFIIFVMDFPNNDFLFLVVVNNSVLNSCVLTQIVLYILYNTILLIDKKSYKNQ